ncbi:AAA family ATPase [Cecembia lonarensis]|uniref:Putative ATPase (AAA+ superfamily) n=1 Tax=Cecembia lonarensis (strain CCUG 58316 / KCTC 22772 / LW9) TaxID=1225176 RepID=K1LZP6_CECL9|nr:ATP-binding protein [Cecembia lonarensis]EKB49589.1 putative ATPase (AAA+ superfamily) [Cecembia lonarensis LW9]
MHPTSPFPTTGYYGPKYFCDREIETQNILSMLTGGESCLLLGIRRLGKTALIRHVMGKLPKGWTGIYLDILHTENEKEFLNSLASGLLQSIPEKSPFGKNVWNFIKSLRPTISFDALSGIPQVGLDVKDTPKQVKDIFQFLVQQDIPIVVAIDEFQQIGNYPGKNTDAWLRGLIQSLPNVRFIFAGSQQHILSSMFTEPGRPFFKSASPLKIEKIDQQAYAKFIEEKFADEGRSISPSIIYQMLDWTMCHTYYVQLLCNRVFQTGKKFIEEQLWHQEANRILQEQEPFFFHYRSLLTIQQWKLLKAIALEKEVIEPTSKAFVSSHNLGSPSTVLRSLEALQSKELIYKEYKKNGMAFYGVYDVLFQRWMDRQV